MTERSYFMDAMRIVAAHMIVLHHMASYGPMASALEQASPGLAGVLYNYGRFATQIFFVMAGFLAAQGLLTPHPASLGGQLVKRYLRLAPPFLLAILSVALVVTWLRPYIDQDWLTEPPTVWQWVSHVFLIQDLIGQPSMTVGAWYVAIDFQLFALLNILAWGLWRLGARRESVLVPVALLCLASQWYFNRDPAWDRWAIYFFESYGLGALLALMLHGSPQVQRSARALLVLCAVSAVIAGLVFPRPRLLLSVLVCLLIWWGMHRWHPSARSSKWLLRHSDASYSLFITHFMPLVAANAAWITWRGQSPAWGVALLLLTWWVCVVWSFVFQRLVQTLMRTVRRPRSAGAAGSSSRL